MSKFFIESAGTLEKITTFEIFSILKWLLNGVKESMEKFIGLEENFTPILNGIGGRPKINFGLF